MWILPPSLSCRFVPESEGSTSDFDSLFPLLERYVWWRGKPSPSRTWSKRWKTVTWTQHLSGRTLLGSTAKRGVASWIASLVATRASHSRSREDELEPTIQDICSHTLPASLQRCNLPWCSSKTSMPTLPLDLKKSESDFKRWATSLRQAYSQRQRWALRIDESGSSFWPTSTTTDAKASGAVGYSTESGRHSGTTVTDAAVRQNWSTIRASNGQHSGPNQKFGAGGTPLPAQAAQWRTPSASDGEGGVMEMREGEDGKYKLRDHAVNAMAQWATPTQADADKTVPGSQPNGRCIRKDLLIFSQHTQNATKKVQPSEGESLSDIAVVKTDEWQTPASFLGKTRRQGVTREQRQASQVEAMLPLQAEMTSLSLSLSPWPPRPNEYERWAEVPEDLQPATQPAFRGVVDGNASRVDRLRALGNGVVPLVAAVAFRTLAKDLGLL